jgi:hypothetical protein
LVAATLLVYAQEWGLKFINVDDPVFVVNPAVKQGITSRNLNWSLHFG